MDNHSTGRSTIRKIATTLAIYIPLAGAAVLYGETQLTPQARQGFYWSEDRGWCATDFRECCRCGDTLVDNVDGISAYRHCQRCELRYRHPTLPATLEEQYRVWQ